MKALQGAHGLCAGRSAKNAVTIRVTAAEVALHGAKNVRIVVNGEDNWFRQDAGSLLKLAWVASQQAKALFVARVSQTAAKMPSPGGEKW